MDKQGSKSDKFPRKFGKYHLLGPLAQGGMGALYLAVTGDRGLERLTVIKTVLPHLADKEYVARFRDEAKVVVQLSHGNLIPVFDAGQVSGELYVAMDFIEGKDLRALWNCCARKQVAFPIDIAVYIVKELCRGLDYAHSFGDLHLVHRDVSPPNVLISYSGEVKLTDFGLASSRLKLEKTAPGIIYGKVAYMSPEQARGDKLDGRSDLYAAAIILWELLTGRQLFPPSKEQPRDLVARAKNPDVPLPSRRAPRVPLELDAICRKGLAGDPAERYNTGEEMRSDLAGWLAKSAPATDAARLGAFVRKLFVEEIDVDRSKRQRLIERARDRAMTMPPTDELRRLLTDEGTQQHGLVREEGGGAGNTIRFGVGRRAEDRVGVARERRAVGRRSADRTDQGVVVDVPRPHPDGRTVVRPETASGALALSSRADVEADPDDPASVLGTVIDGRYQVLELIGEGGMGRVYLAEHVEIGKRVAIKILHAVYSRMPELVERFRREARAASRIGHPHIVDVTDSGTTAHDAAYFVMEYLEGVELASVIDREGALRVDRSLNIAAQICRALAVAHAVSVIHRDLKPENVFLTAREGTSDFVKVLDFGIAKSAEAEEARSQRLTHPGMAMGTPEYMAPEQAAGKPADGRTDIYAVGAILYEMLTGVPPYQGDNFMEILTKKATQDPAPLAELRSDLPDQVVKLVERAMARRPEDRPPSMEALEYEITKALQGRGKAVANILGMQSDVAGTGGGSVLGVGSLSSPRIESTTVTGETRSSGPRPAQIPARTSDRVIVETADVVEALEGGAVARQPRVERRGDVSTESVPAIRTGRAARAAWALFAVALVLGAGVVVYVAVGEGSASERGALVATPMPGAGDGVASRGLDPEARGSEVEPAGLGADAGSPEVAAPADAGASPTVGSDRSNSGGTDDRPEAVPGRDRRPEGGPGTDTPERAVSVQRSGNQPPHNKREAKKLLQQARGFEARLRWGDARESYERVARGRYFKASGLLGIAKVAFETKEMEEAIRYGKRALDAGGGNSARMLLGHAYFKRNQLDKAVEYYRAVLTRKPDHKEAKDSLSEALRRQGKL